jgi:formylmethanofuran--tetrahydromethanopterin N-formyltransferase
VAAIVDDTYAEAFRSIYAEVLVTARDRTWLEHAVNAATGHASSTIMCDCEAGVDRWIDPASESETETTPDGRPGAVLQFHVPRFRKDREPALERALLTRIAQNVLTCPTTACFNWIDGDTCFKLGRKIALFGDGHQFRDFRFERRVWVVPTMMGEFVLDRRFGFRDGIMGGNLWFLADTVDSALMAAELALKGVRQTPGVVAPFPGGVAASGSKAGSRYSFLFASTNHPFCPTLREKLGAESQVPPEVQSISEIIINGHDLETVQQATRAAIAASIDTPGLVRISAGNYGGRLGKNFIHLRERNREAADEDREPTTDNR